MAAALGAGLASFLIPHFGTPILHIAIAGVVFLIAFVLLMVAVRPLQREDLDAVKAVLGKLPEPLRMLAGSR
jgi:membrane protein implicated in regulation of membrane protease activity